MRGVVTASLAGCDVRREDASGARLNVRSLPKSPTSAIDTTTPARAISPCAISHFSRGVMTLRHSPQRAQAIRALFSSL